MLERRAFLAPTTIVAEASMNDPLDPSTIIFALLAIFVLWKLRSVLGTRTGQEKPPPADPFSVRRTIGTNDNKIVPLPGAAPHLVANPPPPPTPDRWKPYAEPGSKLAAGLDAIAAADPSFAIGPFMAGAKQAYELIVTAFAAGNRLILQNLLEKEVFGSFSTAIAARENRGEEMETKVISIDQVGINDAAVRDRMLQLTLRFAAKLTNVTRNQSEDIVDGDPNKIVDMVDVWTFARDAGSPDPNWKLIATQTGH